MSRFTTVTLTSIFLFLALSCEKEVLYTGNMVPTATGTVRCNVRTVETKSYELDLDSLKQSGFNLIGIVDSSYYQNYVLQNRGLYFGPSNVSYNSKWIIAGSPQWISNVKTRFWAWNTSEGVQLQSYADSTLCGKNELSFDYHVRSDGDCDDILFAYNDIDYNVYTNRNAKLNLKFAHSLARIDFMVTPKDSSEQLEGDGSYRIDYKLVDITLKNVCDSGHCVITGVSNDYPSFEWSGQKGNISCRKIFNTTFNTFTDFGWTGDFLTKESIFVIPQTISDTTSLAVTFSTPSLSVTKSVFLKDVGGATAWEIGKYYTYRITIKSELTKSANTLAISMEEWGDVR